MVSYLPLIYWLLALRYNYTVICFIIHFLSFSVFLTSFLILLAVPPLYISVIAIKYLRLSPRSNLSLYRNLSKSLQRVSCESIRDRNTELPLYNINVDKGKWHTSHLILSNIYIPLCPESSPGEKSNEIY